MKKYTVELSFMVPGQTVKLIEAENENFAREIAEEELIDEYENVEITFSKAEEHKD